MYTVSVIMPVFNNEKTLRSAIDSILNQTMFDMELILINDGSTDASAQICQEYEKMEPLIVEVVHQNRKGFAAARNRGLSIATGKYIYFAHAYDTYHKRLLQHNVKLAEDKKVNLVTFGFSICEPNNPNEVEEHLPNLPFLPNKDCFRTHYRNFHHFFPFELSNKLYRRSFLMKHRLKFLNLSFQEEAFFNLQVYRYLESVAFNRQSYFVRSKEHSVQVSEYNEHVFESNMELAKTLEKLFKEWQLADEFEDLILSAYFNAIYSEVQNVCSSHSLLSLKEQELRIEEILQDQRLHPYLKHFNKIKMKNPLKLTILSILRNGNGKAALKIVNRMNETKERTSKFFGFFRKVFRTNS
ncbi:MAG TPA: glycosyltransferase family 2 protein [Atopostipes sp.]|nr:glycosyltransferase family 2 protein [Atopostipes sp.]